MAFREGFKKYWNRPNWYILSTQTFLMELYLQYPPSFHTLMTSWGCFWLLMCLILTLLVKSRTKIVKMGNTFSPWDLAGLIAIMLKYCLHLLLSWFCVDIDGRCLDTITCLHCDILVHFSEQVKQQLIDQSVFFIFSVIFPARLYPHLKFFPPLTTFKRCNKCKNFWIKSNFTVIRFIEIHWLQKWWNLSVGQGLLVDAHSRSFSHELSWLWFKVSDTQLRRLLHLIVKSVGKLSEFK